MAADPRGTFSLIWSPISQITTDAMLTSISEQGRNYKDKPQEISVFLIEKRNIANKKGLSADQLADAVLQLSHVRLDREHIKIIDNLDCLGYVTNLYLQHNEISTIENLETLTHLRFLTLAGNRISRLENLMCLKSLKFLDLSDNKIDDIVCFAEELPCGLIILNLEGNPCTGLPNYRSTVVRALPSLQQFDGKAVLRQERLDAGCQFDEARSDTDSEGSDKGEEEEKECSASHELSTAVAELRLEGGTTGMLKQHSNDIIIRAKIRAMKEDAAHEKRLDELASIRTQAIDSARRAKDSPPLDP